jgi:ribosome maturation factor RimP
MAGHYTLEVSSPGLERSLRTPAHFQKSIGRKVAVRLRDIDSEEGEARRAQGVLVAADDRAITVRLDDADSTERLIPYDKIDRARTIFEWGPAPKPGKQPAGKQTAGRSKT